MNLSFEIEAHERFLAHLKECHKRGTSLNYAWPPATPAWEAMMKKADELRWPLRYREDLVLVDRESMHQDSSPCLWGIREAGTHIVRDLPYFKAVVGAFDPVWYFWDGHTLAEVSRAEAEAIARSWE